MRVARSVRKGSRGQTSKPQSPGPAAHPPTSLSSAVSDIMREVTWPRAPPSALTPRPEQPAQPGPVGRKRAEPSRRKARRSQMKTRLFLHAHPAAPWETWRDTPAGGHSRPRPQTRWKDAMSNFKGPPCQEDCLPLAAASCHAVTGWCPGPGILSRP